MSIPLLSNEDMERAAAHGAILQLLSQASEHL